MNVIFTCGGTAGHVNPALALAGQRPEGAMWRYFRENGQENLD